MFSSNITFHTHTFAVIALSLRGKNYIHVRRKTDSDAFSQLLMLWDAWLFAVKPQLRPLHSLSQGWDCPPVGCSYDMHYKNLLLKKKY